MAAEIPTFCYVLYLATGHDAFVFTLTAQTAKVCAFFSLGQLLRPVWQKSYDLLVIFCITRYFQRHSRPGEYLLHDMLQLHDCIIRFRPDSGSNPADKFIVRKFAGIAESFYR